MVDQDGSGGTVDDGAGYDGSGQWTVPGYTHVRKLGSGASGLVVRARHNATGRAVAVKYLAGPLGQDRRFREAFRGEAHLLGDLDSPHIARFYEYVEDGPDAAIVMELVDGISLHALLREEGATDPEPALAVLKGSLLGLAAAHAAGVVHRDYKPANVLVTTDGVSKLVDFGVAVRSGETAGVAGTPSYMAPEQWAGGPATPATDVYAATATFFECVTGSKPYTGSTMFELAVQHTEAPIPNALVPEPVRPLVLRGLAKTPPERPQSAADFVAELQAVACAAYGEDWEERGQRKLAALVALLPLLLPSASAGGSGTTALAHTELGRGPGGSALGGAAAGASAPHGPARRARVGRRGKILAGVVAGVLISAGLAVTAVATGGGTPAHTAAATHKALTSLTSGSPTAPGTGTGTRPAPAGDGSPSATSSAPGAPTGTATTPPADRPTTADPGGTATATVPPTGTGTGGGTGTGTGTGGGTGTGTAGGTAGGTGTGTGGGKATTAPPTTKPATSPPPTTPPPPPALHVASVTFTRDLMCSGSTSYTGLALVTVTTDGAADGTLTLTWFHTDRSKVATATVGTDSVKLTKGKTSFQTTVSHYFGAGDTSFYWGLSLSTNPAAAAGNGVSETVRACGPVIT